MSAKKSPRKKGNKTPRSNNELTSPVKKLKRKLATPRLKKQKSLKKKISKREASFDRLMASPMSTPRDPSKELKPSPKFPATETLEAVNSQGAQG